MVKNKRGDIVLVAGGTYTTKPRPVLILQNLKYRTGESIIVIPFTSAANPEVDTRISVSPTPENGLDRNCFLEIDKISAIKSTYIGKRIGRLENEALRKTLSIAVKLISE
jgi:mRNA interferase MazF